MIIGSGVEGRRIFRDRGRLGMGPARIRPALDAIGVMCGGTALTEVWQPELLLDALWVTVAIGAFLFGLHASLARIGLAALVTLAHTILVATRSTSSFELELLDLTDWALLILISIVVAVMADRVSSTARRYAELYRQASERLVSAHEEERQHLARDLHDGVGQTLTAAVLSLDTAEIALDGVAGGRPSSARIAIRRAKSLTSTALDEARDVAARLRPVRMRDIGLGAAIHDLAETAGIPVDVRFDPAILPPGLLDPEREIDAFRIIQEAVGNAARHSRAGRVTIDVRRPRGWVRITVRDDGAGFGRSARDRGLGLAGMQERAAILFGRIEVRSRLGRGTTVRLAFPLAPPGNDPPSRSGRRGQAPRPAVASPGTDVGVR